MSQENIKNTLTLNASSLRILLIVCLIAIVAIGFAGFTYARQILGSYATEIAHKKVDASASDSTISSLEKIEQTMQENKGLIDKIDTLRADNPFPEFMIVDEVKQIAKRNNISISSYSFGSSNDGGQQNATNAPTGQTGTPAAAPSAGTISLTVNFGAISSYKNYLQFLYDIQQHVPKMRINGVGVSNGSGGDTNGSSGGDQQQQKTSKGGVQVEPLIIEMYIKKR